MNRDNIFWGTALILVGVLLFLQTQGIITNVFRYFWPLALILVGGWLILNVYWRPTPSAGETFMIPLGTAKSARFTVSHGAGQLEITGGAPVGQALVGSSAAGMDQHSRSEGERLEVRISAGPSFVPFIGPSEGIWRFQLTQEVPLTLKVESGASSLNLDLRDVLATHIELETGASSSNVTMPARGVSLLDVEGGVASVNVRVPETTSARIRVKEGAASVNVDTTRFPRLDSGLFQSADFDTAVNRAEINVESSLGSVSVK
ncbi:MAG: LiaI-LiaF-like domain-containing protein [Anaerolineales bacterium]